MDASFGENEFMVVKLNKIILIYFIAFYSNRVFSQDNNHNSWKNVFLEAYSNLPEVQKIINNKKQAEIVENYVYIEKHSYMGDYFSAIDEVAEMVEKVLNAK